MRFETKRRPKIALSNDQQRTHWNKDTMTAGMQSRSTWTSFTAAALCTVAFAGQALHPECLDLDEGRRVLILEETKDWFRGCLVLNETDQLSTRSSHTQKLGIFPKQNVMLTTNGSDDEQLMKMINGGDDNDISAQVLWVLKDWKAALVRLLADQQYAKFNALMLKFQKVLDYRQALLPGALSAKECRGLKGDLMAEIEAGNQLLGESIRILRDPASGSLLCKERSFLDMYRCQEAMSTSNSLQNHETVEPKPGNRSLESSMHLLLTLKGVSGAESRELHCTFGILSGRTQTFITECFRAKASLTNPTSSDEPSFSAERAVTLFKDLDSNAVQTGDLYLVCRIAQKDKNGILRPFGNGVSPLAPILGGGRYTNLTHLSDCRLPIFVPQDESNWANYSDLIQQDHSNLTTHLSTSTAIHVGLDVFHGRLSVIKEEYPILFNDLRMSNRLGMAHVSESSLGNHMHVSLQTGDFSSFHKMTGLHDHQVEMQVRLPNGEFISCLNDGTGKDAAIKSISSIVYSNNPFPVWNLSIRLDMEPETLLKSHLYLTFRNMPKGKTEDSRHFAFAFLPLFQKPTSPIKDGDHTVNLYKFEELLESPAVYLTLPAGPSIFVPAAFSALTASQLKDAAEVMGKMKPSMKDTVQISTLLDSRLLTSSTPLLNLLEWKTLMTQQRGDILKIVDDACLVEAEEVIKFYPVIINTLFEILDMTISEAEQESLNEIVFKCLIQALAVTQDKRFVDDAGDVDRIFQDIFVTHRVSARLYDTLKKFMQQPMDPIEARTLRSAIKVWHFIYRFILKPFILENDLVAGQKLISGFMKQVHWVMQNHNSDIALASQMLILQHFSSLLTEWTPLFSSSAELIDIADSFMSGIKAAHSKIVTFRYAFMKQFISSDLSNIPVNQKKATCLVVHWLNGVLSGKWGKLPTDESSNRRMPRLKGLAFATSQKRHDLKSCLDFIMFFLDALKTFNADALVQVLDLLPALLNSFVNFMDWCKMRHSQPKKSASSSPKKLLAEAQTREILPLSSGLVDAPNLLLSDLTAALVAILDVNPPHRIENHFSQFASEKDNDASLVYLSEWLSVIRHLTTEIFPSQTVSVAILMKHNTLNLLRALGGSIGVGICSGTDAQKSEQLQNEFLQALLVIIQLHLAQCSSSRSQEQLVMVSMNVEILSHASTLLLEIWSKFEIGESASQFTGAFLEMALSDNVNLRDVGIRILFSLMLFEFKSHGSISRLEDAIFEQMPWVIEKSRDIHGSQVARQFEGLFKEVTLSTGDKKCFSDQGRRFIHFLETFLALMIDIKEVSDGSQNEEAKASSMLKMIQFLSETNRRPMRSGVFQSLYELHLSSGNFVEAAMLLKHYADSLPGTSTNRQMQNDVTGSLDSSREDVYWQCIEMFDKGNAWERAVDVCHVLAASYSSELYDYEQLSLLLKKQAELLDKIAKNERFFPSYFRAGFFGNGFPSNIEGKAFVYKGLEWEKLGSFCDRMLKNYPNSKIVKDVPSVELEDGARLLHITWLDPVMDSEVIPGRNRATELPWLEITGSLSSCVTSGPKNSSDLLYAKAISDLEVEIPEFVLRYFKASETNTFISSKNIRRNVHESLSDLPLEHVECLSLASEFTVSYTRERFPHLANRSEIIGTHSFEMKPIEHAIMAIGKKTKELSSLSSKFSGMTAKQKSDTHPAWSRGSFDSEFKRRSDDQPNTSPFTMALNGAVDAPVNGGIPLYKSVFLNSKFVALLKEEGEDNILNSFKEAIDEQVIVMNSCLKVHGEVISPEMRPLHNELISLFNKNFYEEISRLNLVVSRSSARSSFETSAPRPSSASTTSQMSFLITEVSPMPEIRKNSMASMLSLRSSFSQNDENSKRFSGGISHSSIDVSVHEKDSTKNHSSAIQRVNEETTVVNISPTKLKPMQHFSSRRKILRLFERRPANE